MLAKDRLAEVISSRNLNLKEFSDLIGVNYRTLQHYLAGERKIGVEFLENLSEQLGISASWLLTGLGEQMLTLSPNSGFDAAGSDFIQIDRHAIEVSAGHGANGETEADSGTGQYAFNRKWLDRRGLKPDALSVISVRGDSMEPEINDNDLVLLDHTDATPKDGHIYVVRYSGDVYVKRLQKLPGDQIQLVSKNTDYPPIVIKNPEADGVEVIGRVVCSMHEW